MSTGNHAQRIRRFALPTVLAALLLTGAAATILRPGSAHVMLEGLNNR
jgi:hypothetical protein